MSGQEAMDQNVSWTQFYILMAIANGHAKERNIRHVVRISADALRQQILELNSRGFIEREGRILKSWKLTTRGIDMLSLYDDQFNLQTKIQPPIQRSETRIVTTFGTAFKATLGAILGIFAGIAVVGVIASLIYWAGYTFIVKSYVPPQLLPYIPLDNPLIDIILGLMTSIALFIPLRNKLSLGSLLGR